MSIEDMGEVKPHQKTELGLSPKEVDDVVSIVDGGPKHLDKVTPDNIRDIVTEGERLLIEERQHLTDFSNQTPLEIFEILLRRSSESHAIQCSVFGAEDFKTFQGHLIDKQPDEFVENFLKRHIGMKKLLTQLYKIDIARRIGLAKDEKTFFEQEKPNFIELAGKLKESIDEFENANKEKIAELPDVQNTIADLRNNLNKMDYESLDETFYSEICQKYSNLIFNDFEILNEDELKQSLKK